MNCFALMIRRERRRGKKKELLKLENENYCNFVAHVKNDENSGVKKRKKIMNYERQKKKIKIIKKHKINEKKACDDVMSE